MSLAGCNAIIRVQSVWVPVQVAITLRLGLHFPIFRIEVGKSHLHLRFSIILNHECKDFGAQGSFMQMQLWSFSDFICILLGEDGICEYKAEHVRNHKESLLEGVGEDSVHKLS